MAGASYDRHNAYVALPQIEKDVQEAGKCPHEIGSICITSENKSPALVYRHTNWEQVSIGITNAYAWVRKA